MYRSIIILALAGIGLSALVVVGYVAAKPGFGRATVTLLHPRDPADRLLWPTNNSWLWSVSQPDRSLAGEFLSLVLRVVHQQLREGEAPAIGPWNISKEESEAEIKFGRIVFGPRDTARAVLGGPRDPVLVGLQIIDLREAGLPFGEQPLRLLLHFQAGGTGLSRKGEQSVIEGDHFLGQAPHPAPGWQDGELHLQSLFIQVGDQLAIYDVVLVRSKDTTHAAGRGGAE